jgi:ribosomal protein S9
VQIDATKKEKYEELLKEMPSIDELVMITLFDMKGSTPVQISQSWGGANSQQGARAIGAAAAITAASDQFRLWLHKPVCVTKATLGSMSKS